MDMKVYPHAPEAGSSEDKITASTVAQEIIDLRENGAPADHPKYAEGEPMSKNAILSYVLHGKNAPKAVAKVWDDIEAERKALRSVPVTGTKGDYQAELENKAKYLDSVAFMNGLMEEKEVATWTDLKAKYSE
jgi:hypothetical protein